MACFFAAHEETIVFLLVDVLIKPMALLPAKWERSWSPTCSKGNSGINLNNERKNLNSVVLTDNIQIIFIPAAIKSWLPQRDGKQFQRASPFPPFSSYCSTGQRWFHFRDHPSSCFQRITMTTVKHIHHAVLSPSMRFPRGQDRVYCSNSWWLQTCCIQNNSNMKATGFGRYPTVVYLSS